MRESPAHAPTWLSSSNLLWAGACLSLLLVLLTASFALYQRNEITAQEMRRTQLLVRLLEGETSRTLEAAELTLTSAAHRLGAAPLDSPDLGARLGELIRGLPYLRSLTVLDAAGRVVASSGPRVAGSRIDLRILGRPVRPDEAWLGPWLPGRDLIDPSVRPGDTDGPRPRRPLPGVGVLTLIRQGLASDGQPCLIVAALNPDHLANRFQQIMEDPALGAVLIDYQGQMLASTEAVHLTPGASLQSHRALQDYLPEREHGTFQGPGIEGQEALTSFRASRRHPLAVIVEEPITEIGAQWYRKLGWTAVGTVALLLLVGAGTAAGWRSLRTHETLSAALDRTRQRLEDSERHLRAIIEAAPAPMFVLDALGRYAIVNQAFEDFLGVRREDLIQTRAEGHPTLAQIAYHPVRDLTLWTGAGGQSSYMDDLVVRDGARRQALVSKVALARPDGRPGGVIGSITDVTSFREAERRAAEAMLASQAAHRAESEFIGNLSHALRTPLQSIIGFSELGSMRSHGDPALQDLFTHALEGGRRMLDVVDDLLDLSQVKDAAGTLHCASFDTAPLVDEVLHHARIDAGPRQVELRMPTPLCDTRAWIDPLRFQQAMRTLVDRAIQVSPIGGHVEIRATRDDAGMLRWQVQDSGQGVPDNECDAIFGAFFQSRRPGQTSPPGSGLQLAICRQILRGLGGDATCTNHPGGGSILHVTLPAMDDLGNLPAEMGRGEEKNPREMLSS